MLGFWELKTGMRLHFKLETSAKYFLVFEVTYLRSEVDVGRLLVSAQFQTNALVVGFVGALPYWHQIIHRDEIVGKRLERKQEVRKTVSRDMTPLEETDNLQICWSWVNNKAIYPHAVLHRLVDDMIMTWSWHIHDMILRLNGWSLIVESWQDNSYTRHNNL